MDICLIDIYVGKGPEDIQYLGRDTGASVRVCPMVLGFVFESFREKLFFHMTV